MRVIFNSSDKTVTAVEAGMVDIKTVNDEKHIILTVDCDDVSYYTLKYTGQGELDEVAILSQPFIDLTKDWEVTTDVPTEVGVDYLPPKEEVVKVAVAIPMAPFFF